MIDPQALGRMQIRRVEIYPVSLPQTADLVSNAASAMAMRPVVYVRVLGENGEEGWGECCALAGAGYTPESSALCARVLAEYCAPILLHSGVIQVDDVRRILDAQLKEWNMSKAAIEAAVLDALLRRAQMSLVSFLQGERTQVPAGAAVGLPKGNSTEERLIAYVDEVRGRFAEGYQRVRVKAVPQYQGVDWTVLPIKTLRDEGIAGVIQPDGNMSYQPDDIATVASLSDHGVELFEQPFGRRRFQDHRRLRKESVLSVVADESIESFDDVLLALDEDARSFDVVCNKWSRVGGILESARINEECVRQGVKVFMGGMIGIGTHVDLALASMIPDELDAVGDHGPSGKWIQASADPTPAISWSSPGWVGVSHRVGVVDVDRDVLIKWMMAEMTSVERDSQPLALWPVI